MVAKSLDLNDIPWRRRSFALSNKKRKVIEYRFVPECNHAQESHYMSIFFLSAISAGPWFVGICKFCYHGNMMYWLLLSIVSNVWYILMVFLKKQTLKKRCITELELKLTLTFKKLLLIALPFSSSPWANITDKDTFFTSNMVQLHGYLHSKPSTVFQNMNLLDHIFLPLRGLKVTLQYYQNEKLF